MSLEPPKDPNSFKLHDEAVVRARLGRLTQAVEDGRWADALDQAREIVDRLYRAMQWA